MVMHQNLFLSSCAKISFFIMLLNIDAQCYAGHYAEFLVQSVHYAGHVNGNMDFFPVWVSVADIEKFFLYLK